MAKKKAQRGRGRKICPKCGKVLGARTHQCECGHTFTAKQRTAKQKRTPLDYSLEELRELMEAKKKLVGPLTKLIKEHGADVVLAEAERLAKGT